MNSNICTFSGRYFDPLNPKSEGIYIEDIAHALSLMCRFNGHIREFYSVAEHSIRATECVSTVKDKLWVLFHDAAEAYIADLITPIKQYFSEYKTVEDNLLVVIGEAFNLGNYPTSIVKMADVTTLATEVRDLHNTWTQKHFGSWTEGVKPLKNIIIPWSPQQAENEFLVLARNLFTEREVKND